LEVFSAIIRHHPAENPNITYGILQSRKIFEDLGTFNLARGLREVRRIQLAKEEREKNLTDPKAKTKAIVDDVELADAGAEKARLLQNEGATQQPDVEVSLSARTSEEVLTTSAMSPRSDNPYDTLAISEKVRGKMRERSSLSVDSMNSLDRVPLSIGRNGFIPTQEWVTSWQQGYAFSPPCGLRNSSLH
jgi:hypothetical protein